MKVFQIISIIIAMLSGAVITYYYLIPLRQELVISQPETGEYNTFLLECFEFLNRVGKSTSDYNITNISKVITEGSENTIKQLQSGEADIGLIQSDTRIEADNVRAIAFVFDEVFLWITKSDKQINPYDIHDHKIGTFMAKSQTTNDLKKILSFYGHADPDGKGDYKLKNGITLEHGTYEQGVERISNLNSDTSVDSLFYITGFGNDSIRELFASKGYQFIQFRHLDALLRRYPTFTKSSIPAGMFGRHSKNYESPAVKATLVTRSTLDDSFVYYLTRELFEHEGKLARRHAFADVQEVSLDLKMLYPLHEGAKRFYKQKDPSFFDRNYRVISLIFGALGLIGSLGPFIYSKLQKDN